MSQSEGISLEDLVVVYEMRADGVPWKWISRVMGLDIGTMNNAVTRAETDGLGSWLNYGVSTRGMQRRYTEAQLRHAMYLRIKGHSWAHVAEEVTGDAQRARALIKAVDRRLKVGDIHDQRLFNRRRRR